MGVVFNVDDLDLYRDGVVLNVVAGHAPGTAFLTRADTGDLLGRLENMHPALPVGVFQLDVDLIEADKTVELSSTSQDVVAALWGAKLTPHQRLNEPWASAPEDVRTAYQVVSRLRAQRDAVALRRIRATTASDMQQICLMELRLGQEDTPDAVALEASRLIYEGQMLDRELISITDELDDAIGALWEAILRARKVLP